MGNTLRIDNRLLNEALQGLEQRLPPRWSLSRQPSGPRKKPGPDAWAELAAGGPEGVRLGLALKPELEPREVAALAHQVQAWPSPAQGGGVPLVVARFLSPRTRDLLQEAQLNYLDLTGNCRLVSDRPALFVCTTGAATHPQPLARERRSLKGPIAGRVVRALADFAPPVGIRELAERASADPGYVSRLVQALEREALLERVPRGAVVRVDREALLRRWAEESSWLGPEWVSPFLEPRGLPVLLDKLRQARFPYVLTGSVAAAAIAPVAPARLAVAYVEDPEQAARELGLIPAETGANVWLVTPFDPVVFERSWGQENLRYAAFSQVAADLLLSPGRGPEEAEALFPRLKEDADAWPT